MSGTTLKWIALIAMTFDHVGLILLQNYEPFRIVGRIAFPLFAFMIAEGCRYTHNRGRYLGVITALALGCQLAFTLFTGAVYFGILAVFSLSIAIIFIYEHLEANNSLLVKSLLTIVLLGISGLTYWLGAKLHVLDYGIWGVWLPVLVYLAPTRMYYGLFAFVIGLILIAWDLGGIQWWSILAIPLVAFYNGERGLGMKWIFYIYYPLHFVIIFIISQLLS